MAEESASNSDAAPLVIDAVGLRKTYGDVVAVDNISFQVRKGELFGLLGPNGAGKTSTIRMLYGFSPMTAGSLRVMGMDVRTDWRAIRARTGVCHQENNVDPDLSVRGNLDVFAKYFGLTRRVADVKIDNILKFMGLEHRAKSPVMELSGGMMRRLILARTFMNDPEFAILDEPTTGLDPQSRQLVWERLAELKKKGATILLTTHYMEEAARLCDRLMIVDHGKILAEGTPRELVHKHVGRNVIESSPVCEELRSFVAGRGLEFEDLGSRMLIYCRDDEPLFQEINRRFCQDDCILRTATLEDVFLRLTGRDMRE